MNHRCSVVVSHVAALLRDLRAAGILDEFSVDDKLKFIELDGNIVKKATLEISQEKQFDRKTLDATIKDLFENMSMNVDVSKAYVETNLGFDRDKHVLVYVISV